MAMRKSSAVAGKSTGSSSHRGGGYRTSFKAPGGGGAKGRSTGSSQSRVTGGVQGGGSGKPAQVRGHSGTGGGKATSGNMRGGPTSLGPSRNRPGAGGGPDQYGKSQTFSSRGRTAQQGMPSYEGGLPNERAPRAHVGYGRGNG